MDLQPALVATGSTGRVLLAGRVLVDLQNWHFTLVSAVRGWHLSSGCRIINEYWLRQAMSEGCTLELDINDRLWRFRDVRIAVEGQSLQSWGFDKPEMRMA